MAGRVRGSGDLLPDLVREDVLHAAEDGLSASARGLRKLQDLFPELPVELCGLDACRQMSVVQHSPTNQEKEPQGGHFSIVTFNIFTMVDDNPWSNKRGSSDSR